MTIILDPGHGMSNSKAGKYDPGAVSGKSTEAAIVMEWVNELRAILQSAGHRVVRTRIDDKDSAPVGQRASIARQYGGEIMVSFHCNASNGQANGTETFYRGESNRVKAQHINDVVVESLGTRDRGVKIEAQSQHKSLAIMSFQPCFLIELGFIDNSGDLTRMTDPALRKKACEALVKVIVLK